MDVVLDCLAGEFVDAGLRLLPRGGHFLEMGKTDIRDPAAVAADRPGVAYQAYDLQEAAPDRMREMLTELLGLFARGALTPPPPTVWDVRQARDAFRTLSQARLIGKAVLTVPRRPDPEGTFVVTGAGGNLGGLVARHLVTRYGARHLLLLGRRGPAAPGAAELAAELRALGADGAGAVACDTADRDALRAVLEGLDRPPTAIVHAAGVLDDGLAASLTDEQLHRVLRPKTDSAAHLDALTRELGHDPALFVLFSSASGFTGNPGQANYAAANTSLDALAAHRRADGLAGTSLLWGAWEQSGGMTAGLSDTDQRRMARSGLLALSPEQGLALFDTAIGADTHAVAPIALDIGVLRKQAEAGTLAPVFRGLVQVPLLRRAAGAAPGAPGAAGLAERLAVLTDTERDRLLLDLVRTHTATVLGHGSADSSGVAVGGDGGGVVGFLAGVRGADGGVRGGIVGVRRLVVDGCPVGRGGVGPGGCGSAGVVGGDGVVGGGVAVVRCGTGGGGRPLPRRDRCCGGGGCVVVGGRGAGGVVAVAGDSRAVGPGRNGIGAVARSQRA